MLIVINSHNSGLFEIVNNSSKRSSSCSSNIQHILNTLLVFVSESNLSVGGSNLKKGILREEFRVNVLVDSCRNVAHYSHKETDEQ